MVLGRLFVRKTCQVRAGIHVCLSTVRIVPSITFAMEDANRSGVAGESARVVIMVLLPPYPG